MRASCQGMNLPLCQIFSVGFNMQVIIMEDIVGAPATRTPLEQAVSYDAVLFDFDGVLADTEPLHYEAWRDALKPLGITLDWAFYRSELIGVSDRELVERLARTRRPPLQAALLWARFANKQRLFLEKALARPPIPKENIELISSLKNRKLALVTSTSILEIRPLLLAADLLERFHVIVTAEDVNRHKPDPEPYLVAARRLGARRALAVEDSDAGERAARDAGLEVVRVHSVAEVPKAVLSRLADGGQNL